MQSFGRWQDVRAATGWLTMKNSPGGDALLLFSHGPRAGEIGSEGGGLRLLRKREGGLSLGGLAHLADDNCQEVREVGSLGQFTRQQIESGGALLTPALGGLLRAQAG